MSTTNPETGETIGGRSPRFTYWAAFLFFSLVTLIASVEQKNESTDVDSDGKRNQNWAVACSAITFTFTFIMVLAMLHPVSSLIVVGTKLEGVVCIILLAFWAATVAIVSDSSHGLAVDEDGAVQNGNLYYFSWAGFVTAVLLMVSYLRGVFGVDVPGELKSRSTRLTAWSALLASLLIVLGVCANVFDQDCNPQVASDTYCKRTKYGLSMGAIGTFFSLVIVGLKLATSSAPFMLEAVTSFILTCMTGFGVAFLTSAKGPGAALGNLYYFSWISVFCSAIVMANCFEEYKGAGAAAEENANGENGEIQVESLDETI